VHKLHKVCLTAGVLLHVQAPARPGTDSPGADEYADLDPTEAFERAELQRKAAAAGDPSSTAFYAAKKHTKKVLNTRQPGSPAAIARRPA
jgi:hypothetical protein